MLYSKAYFEEILCNLEEQLKKSKAELADCPQGSLQQEVRNGRAYFFYAKPKADGKVHRQVVNNSPEIMQGLLRGNYLKCEIAALEQDVRLLQYLQAHFREYSPRELLQKMPKRLRSFSPELFFPQAADAWQEQEYEQVLHFGKHKLVPDFVLKNKRTGKLYYWEHCGLVNNPSYMEHHRWKLGVYEKAGIAPWDNLIVTYDGADGNLNLAIVESEIKTSCCSKIRQTVLNCKQPQEWSSVACAEAVQHEQGRTAKKQERTKRTQRKQKKKEKQTMSRENIGTETACSKKREIRPLTQQDIEAYLDIYLNSYPAYKSLDAECRQHYREKHQLELREDREVQTVGLFEDGMLIATMKLVSFSMNFFGKMQPACGLMALEVHPLHKKKGAALEMVRYFETYAKENGALLTLLLPFKIGFYRQMGYGFAGKLYEYHLPTAVLPKMGNEARQHLRLMQPEDFDEALACYNRFAARNHGMVEKFEEEVRGSRDDIQVRRIGYYADAAAGNACTDGAAEADGACRACEAAQEDTDGRDGQPRLRGYVAYRFESASETNYTQNRLSVEELIYDSGEVLRALLGALKMQEDLAQTVILRTGEENFHHLLSDPQDISKNYIDFGFLQTNISAVGTMFKIVEPEAFIQKTDYRVFPSGSLTAEFCYFDEMRHAEQKIRICFADGRWSLAEAGCAVGADEKNTAGAKGLEAAGGPVDVTVHCSQGEFASLLMGSADLGALVRLGAVTVSTGEAGSVGSDGNSENTEQAGAVQMLTQMLYCSQKPWLNADY